MYVCVYIYINICIHLSFSLSLCVYIYIYIHTIRTYNISPRAPTLRLRADISLVIQLSSTIFTNDDNNTTIIIIIIKHFIRCHNVLHTYIHICRCVCMHVYIYIYIYTHLYYTSSIVYLFSRPKRRRSGSGPTCK